MLIKDSLHKQGMNHLMEARVAEYNGTLSTQQRDAVLKKFNRPLCKDYSILLISSTSGRVGINVTRASHLLSTSRTRRLVCEITLLDEFGECLKSEV